jgi:peptide/nickel transport system permease protein
MTWSIIAHDKATGCFGIAVATKFFAVGARVPFIAAIIAEAALSFLGLGQQPPAPSWGSMLNSAQRFLVNEPWMAVWPGLAIFLTVLSFNLVGDGLRDALDPREN